MPRRSAVLTFVVAMAALAGCGLQTQDPSAHEARPAATALADAGLLPPGHPPLPGVGSGHALPEGHPPVPGFEGVPALPEGHPRCPAGGFQASPPGQPWGAQPPRVIST